MAYTVVASIAQRQPGSVPTMKTSMSPYCSRLPGRRFSLSIPGTTLPQVCALRYQKYAKRYCSPVGIPHRDPWSPGRRHLPVMYRGDTVKVNYDPIGMAARNQGRILPLQGRLVRKEVQARLLADEREFVDQGLRITSAVEGPAVSCS